MERASCVRYCHSDRYGPCGVGRHLSLLLAAELRRREKVSQPNFGPKPGGSWAGWGHTQRLADPLGLAAHLNLINNSTSAQVSLYNWAESYHPDQYNTIVVHGTNDGLFSPNATGNIRVAPEVIADLLQDLPGYDPNLPTQLIACSAGAHPSGAQRLADALKANVLASPETLVSNPIPGGPPLAQITLPSEWWGLISGSVVYRAPTWLTFKPH